MSVRESTTLASTPKNIKTFIQVDPNLLDSPRTCVLKSPSSHRWNWVRTSDFACISSSWSWFPWSCVAGMKGTSVSEPNPEQTYTVFKTHCKKYVKCFFSVQNEVKLVSWGGISTTFYLSDSLCLLGTNGTSDIR